MFLRLALVLAAAVLSLARAAAQDNAARLTDLFRPHQTELAALSPDGTHLAYTVREADKLSVVVVAVDQPGVAKAKVAVAEDRLSTPRFSNNDEPTPARIHWMKWVTPTRIVVETNTHVATGADTSLPGLIMAFESDGSKGRILVTPRDVQEFVNKSALELRPGNRERDLFPADFFANDETSDTNDAASEDTIDGGAQLAPLTPRIIDLDPSLPGGVLLRTVGKMSMVVRRLDTATGKLSTVDDSAVDEMRSYLLDRQGRPRISAPAETTIKFPHRLTLERGPGAKRSQDLAKAAGLADEAGFTVSPENFFRARAIPLGFDEKPEILYYASNIGRDTYGVYSVDLVTGSRTGLAIENPGLDLIGLSTGAFGPGGTLVYDRYSRQVVGVRLIDRIRTTRWFDATFQAVQALLEKSLPGRNVEILEWNAERTRFLAAISGPTDAGGFVVFDAKATQLREFARRAPWLDAAPRNRTVSFTVQTQPGLDLPCRLTFSAQPRVKSQPLIILCPSVPWERLPVDFQPEVQALASMGFAVAQPASRGAWGYGIKHRESIHDGYDTAQVADLVRIADEIAKVFAVDSKRVGLIGAGHGAFVALRALQLHPARFRCAVAIEPIVDLGGWLATERFGSRDVSLQLVRSYYGPPARLAENTLVREAERITKPLLILSYPGADGEPRRTTFSAARSFARAVRRPDVDVTFESLSEEFNQGLPRAKADVYQQIEAFLNTTVYDFNVKVGEAAPVPNQ